MFCSLFENKDFMFKWQPILYIVDKCHKGVNVDHESYRFIIFLIHCDGYKKMIIERHFRWKHSIKAQALVICRYLILNHAHTNHAIPNAITLCQRHSFVKIKDIYNVALLFYACSNRTMVDIMQAFSTTLSPSDQSKVKINFNCCFM